MNKAQFVAAISEKTGYSKSDVSEIVDAVFSVTKEVLKKGYQIQVVGFGTYKTITKKARTGRNPKTGESLEIPEKQVVKFKPAHKFLEE